MTIMQGIIGNLIVIIATTSFTLLHSATNIELRITDLSGVPCKSVSVQVPFIIETVIKTDSNLGSTTKPLLMLPSTLMRKSQSVIDQTMIVNNKIMRERHFKEQLIPTEVGSFTIGPATITLDNGTEITSNSVSLKIIPASAHKTPSSGNAFPADPWLELSVEDTPLVVGQETMLRITLYTKEPIEINAWQPPAMSSCRLETVQKGQDAMVERNGITYRSHYWMIPFTPLIPGNLTIEPVRIVYHRPHGAVRNRMLGGFASLIGYPSQQEETSSQPLTITVNPLPSDKGAIHAVGQFDRIEGTISAKQIRLGESLTYTITLVGSSGMAHAKIPTLNVPPSLRAYPFEKPTIISSETEKNLHAQAVLQPLKSGNIEIPEQQFRYYDTKTKTVKTLYTRPLLITVEGDVSLDKNITHQENQAPSHTNDSIKLSPPLERDQQKASTPFLENPSLKIIFGIMLFPLFIAIIAALSLTFIRWWQKTEPERRKKYAFKKACYRMKKACQLKEYNSLYQTLLRACSDRLHAPEVTFNEITQKLSAKGMSVEQLREWETFIRLLGEARFGQRQQFDGSLEPSIERWTALLEALL